MLSNSSCKYIHLWVPGQIKKGKHTRNINRHISNKSSSLLTQVYDVFTLFSSNALTITAIIIQSIGKI